MSRVIIFTICDFDLYLLILLPILELIVLNQFLGERLLLIVALIAVGAHRPVCVFGRLILVPFLGHVIVLVKVLVRGHVQAHPPIVLVTASCCQRLHHHVRLVARRSWILEGAAKAHLTAGL